MTSASAEQTRERREFYVGMELCSECGCELATKTMCRDCADLANLRSKAYQKSERGRETARMRAERRTVCMRRGCNEALKTKQHCAKHAAEKSRAVCDARAARHAGRHI